MKQAQRGGDNKRPQRNTKSLLQVIKEFKKLQIHLPQRNHKITTNMENGNKETKNTAKKHKIKWLKENSNKGIRIQSQTEINWAATERCNNTSNWAQTYKLNCKYTQNECETQDTQHKETRHKKTPNWCNKMIKMQNYCKVVKTTITPNRNSQENCEAQQKTHSVHRRWTQPCDVAH